jgi:hypothetical protein
MSALRRLKKLEFEFEAERAENKDLDAKIEAELHKLASRPGGPAFLARFEAAGEGLDPERQMMAQLAFLETD